MWYAVLSCHLPRRSQRTLRIDAADAHAPAHGWPAVCPLPHAPCPWRSRYYHECYSKVTDILTPLAERSIEAVGTSSPALAGALVFFDRGQHRHIFQRVGYFQFHVLDFHALEGPGHALLVKMILRSRQHMRCLALSFIVVCQLRTLQKTTATTTGTLPTTGARSAWLREWRVGGTRGGGCDGGAVR